VWVLDFQWEDGDLLLLEASLEVVGPSMMEMSGDADLDRDFEE